MPNQPLQAIGVHGQDDNPLRYRKAAPYRAKPQPYCNEHHSYFCSCVYQEAEVSRDYAYEALAEVTSTDMAVGRGALNAALRDIRLQEPELEDSYLLGAEIHERAKMYRQVFPEISLTPNALAKHWQRVKGESGKVRGQNLHAGPPSTLPPLHAQRLAEVTKLKETLWPTG